MESQNYGLVWYASTSAARRSPARSLLMLATLVTKPGAGCNRLRLILKLSGRIWQVGGASAAVHRTIVCVDVEGFGDRRRTSTHQVMVRNGLYGSLQAAFVRSGVSWGLCYHEDRGDGVLILVPPEVPKSLLVGRVLDELATVIAEHNGTHDAEAQIRLRMAVHAGEIRPDGHGVTGPAVNLAFRLLEAERLRAALRSSAGVLAVIASQWFFEEVIRNEPASAPGSYRPVQVSVKETLTSAWICRPDDRFPVHVQTVTPSLPPLVIPRQLPGVISGFAGRGAELDALTDILAGRTEVGGAIVISAVDGTAGIGKTALAVHWAHSIADRFPDGQLYVNLRGFDPVGPPLSSSDAVRGFLDAFEVPSERIPVSRDAQAALYRSLLADRRVLVVLDNARDSDQVRPLLPGSARSLVLVTSRPRLTGLITAEGAHPLTVNLMPVGEARQLLAHRLGPGRVAAEPEAVKEIIAMCVQLPLALSIVSARAVAHPTFRLAALAAELRETRVVLRHSPMVTSAQTCGPSSPGLTRGLAHRPRDCSACWGFILAPQLAYLRLPVLRPFRHRKRGTCWLSLPVRI